MQASDEKIVEETTAPESQTEADGETSASEVVVEAAEVDEAAAEAADSRPEADGEEVPLTLEEQLAAVQAEAEDYKDRWLRSQAEFANARKRMDKQRIVLRATATVDVMKKILPVLDDFERAMASVPEEIAENSWLEGIQLVQRKLLAIPENFNVTPIDAVGQPFDPNFHEAISQEPSDEYDSGVICRELQKGYTIGDQVIRPSLVSVAE